MVAGPHRATLDDFDAIIETLDECFPHDRVTGGMLARWPHCNVRSTDSMHNHIIMKDGDTVASHICIVDHTLAVGNRKIRLAGIHGVSTLPEYRGQGLMTRLLDEAVRIMDEEGYALSDLGGDTQRYGTWGWELAMRQWKFHITPRSFNWNRRETATCGAGAGCLSVAMAKDTNARQCEFTDQIAALHVPGPVPLMKRDAELTSLVLSREGKQIWGTRAADGEVVAYVAASPTPDICYIDEFGGSLAGIEAIIDHLINELDVQTLHVNSPWLDPANKWFFSVSSGWHAALAHDLRMVDLRRTLDAFVPVLSQRYCDYGLTAGAIVTLEMAGTGQRVSLEFSKDGASVLADTSSAAKGVTFSLTPREMIRFLFGLGSPSTIVDLPPKVQFLDALLPLDFYISSLEGV